MQKCMGAIKKFFGIETSQFEKEVQLVHASFILRKCLKREMEREREREREREMKDRGQRGVSGKVIEGVT
jgi:U4/U6.U5 tri-snRNP-associated protein 1